ncbi:hypothetical protein [Gemmatimonas sp.]
MSICRTLIVGLDRYRGNFDRADAGRKRRGQWSDGNEGDRDS